LAVKEPLLALGMLEAGAPVIVDFKDLALSGLDPVIIAVTTLPPLSAAQGTSPEAIVMPGFEYVRNHVLPVTKAKGSGYLNLAAYGNSNLSTEELWGHYPLPLEE